MRMMIVDMAGTDGSKTLTNCRIRTSGTGEYSEFASHIVTG